MKTPKDRAIEKYLKWKEGRDEDYIYDEIHDFISELSRSELLDTMESILKDYSKPLAIVNATTLKPQT